MTVGKELDDVLTEIIVDGSETKHKVEKLDKSTLGLSETVLANSKGVVELGLYYTSHDKRLDKLEKQQESMSRIITQNEKRLTALENVKPIDKPMSIIMYPSGDNFNGIGGGASTVYDNVMTGKWSWEDVDRYDFCSFGHLDYAAGHYSDHLIENMEKIAERMPVVSSYRNDLFYLYHEKGWKNEFSMESPPPVELGEQPRDGAPWLNAVIIMEAAGYKPVGYSTEVTMPYQITLNSNTMEWSIRNSVMQVNNDEWIEKKAKHIVWLRKQFPSISGHYVSATKVQRYVPGRRVKRQFHEWIEGIDNEGWNLATNSGGEQGTWPRAGELYDDYTSDMFDCISGSFKAAKKLRELDPDALIIYVGYNLYVKSWRSKWYKKLFVEAFLRRWPEANEEMALNWWRNSLLDIKHYVDYVEFPEDDHEEDFSKEWADEMRSSQWLKQPPYPQDISKL